MNVNVHVNVNVDVRVHVVCYRLVYPHVAYMRYLVGNAFVLNGFVGVVDNGAIGVAFRMLLEIATIYTPRF